MRYSQVKELTLIKAYQGTNQELNFDKYSYGSYGEETQKYYLDLLKYYERQTGKEFKHSDLQVKRINNSTYDKSITAVVVYKNAKLELTMPIPVLHPGKKSILTCYYGKSKVDTTDIPALETVFLIALQKAVIWQDRRFERAKNDTEKRLKAEKVATARIAKLFN